MVRTTHRWLLVLLYYLATKLRHYAISWQQSLRHALLPYAVKHYHPRWQVYAKPVINWETRLLNAQKTSKPISPVKHRKPLPDDPHCPNCGAPKEYLYNFGFVFSHSSDESFHKVRCKICGFQTAPQRPKRMPAFLCPYCGYALAKVKERKGFSIYKCKNRHCQYRLNNLRANTKAISYIFRDYHLPLNELQLSCPYKPKVDFVLIRYSTTSVALAVIFHIHLGLSLRETAYWLWQLYGLSVSHQTIANWTQSLAFLLSRMTRISSDSNIIAGDETFIHIAGQTAFWNVSYDPENARIVAHHISYQRDTKAASTLIRATVESAPNLKAFVSDDWNPYALALASLNKSNGHIIVKGLKSRGVPADAFLLYKDLLERFFRTFKQRYRRTLGFSNLNGAETFCILFVVYYSYFRPHMRLDGRPPVSILKNQNVLRNWQQLIQTALKAA